jgi:hypothetical protein
MIEAAKKVGAPGLPQVNLLPTEFAEKRAMRAVQITALVAVLISVGVVVVGFVLMLGAKTLADNDRDNALAEQTLAIEERDAKAPGVRTCADRRGGDRLRAADRSGARDQQRRNQLRQCWLQWS